MARDTGAPIDLSGFDLPFASTAGVELTSATPDEVRGRMEWREDRCTTGGILHGGALMTLADTVGAVCAFLNLPAGAFTATIESKTNFLRAVRSGHAGGKAVIRPHSSGG
jgi:1,4-dihydroxy-2-naphthoyl-CoA hydrolase